MDAATFIVEMARALATPAALVVSVYIAARAYRDSYEDGDD